MFMFLATVIARMLAVFVRLVAHVLFAFWKAAAFVRARLAVRLVLGTVATVLVTSFIAAVAVLIVLSSRRAAEPSGGLADAGALGTFISANGTTANEWQIAGPTGPGFVDDAGALDILPNVNLAGAPGTGALQFGQMTGATTLPTGPLTCSSTSTVSFDGTSVSIGPSTASTVNIGGKASGTVNVGDQSATPTGHIFLGPPPGTASQESVTINTGTTGGAFEGNFTVVSSTFRMAEASTDLLLLGANAPSGSTTEILPTGVNVGNGDAVLSSTALNVGASTAQMTFGTTGGGVGISSAGIGWSLFVGSTAVATVSSTGFGPSTTFTLTCGTGGTQVVPTDAFGLVVTTGTLTSNCVLDFSTNAYAGLFVVDLSGATLGATFGVEFENGTATYTATTTNHTSGATLAHVWTHGTNTLVVSY